MMAYRERVALRGEGRGGNWRSSRLMWRKVEAETCIEAAATQIPNLLDIPGATRRPNALRRREKGLGAFGWIRIVGRKPRPRPHPVHRLGPRAAVLGGSPKVLPFKRALVRCCDYLMAWITRSDLGC